MGNEKQSLVKESRSVTTWWGGSGQWKAGGIEGDGLHRSMRKPLGVMDMIIILVTGMASGSYTYVTTHHTVHFKYVQFRGYPLFSNKGVTNILH